MSDIWSSNNLDLRMVTYNILPTGARQGLIELVTDCKTFREIQDRPLYKDDVIDNWLKRVSFLEKKGKIWHFLNV
jgi:phosphatidylinositol kinase/protein kinase (PI-3  family)